MPADLAEALLRDEPAKRAFEAVTSSRCPWRVARTVEDLRNG